jgi:ABC-type antimicrobial peptide transport system permease subunit
MALGAQIRHIVRARYLSSMWSVLVGLVVGIAVSAAALRLAGAFPYERGSQAALGSPDALNAGPPRSALPAFTEGLSPFDPFSYVLAIALILTAALLAALLPVSQAIKLDPASVLRAA